ncbi:MAG TPA: hypothetical protein PKD85_12155 [Saprospiraceae bacterium]|nr:hypothetical protein [Saprospiraceae bacterium]
MRYKEEQIMEWITQHKESGLSIEEFSKGKPFHKSTLSYWYKNRSVDSNSFIELKVPKSDKFIIQILRPDGITININQEFSVQELKQLMQC